MLSSLIFVFYVDVIIVSVFEVCKTIRSCNSYSSQAKFSFVYLCRGGSKNRIQLDQAAQNNRQGLGSVKKGEKVCALATPSTCVSFDRASPPLLSCGTFFSLQ